MDSPLAPALDVAHERGRDLVWCADPELDRAWTMHVPLCRTYGWFRFGGVACDSFVRVRLDEGGVHVPAENRAGGLYLPPRNLVGDGPLLMLLQQRSTSAPVLAAWVETPALVSRRTQCP